METNNSVSLGSPGCEYFEELPATPSLTPQSPQEERTPDNSPQSNRAKFAEVFRKVQEKKNEKYKTEKRQVIQKLRSAEWRQFLLTEEDKWYLQHNTNISDLFRNVVKVDIAIHQNFIVQANNFGALCEGMITAIQTRYMSPAVQISKLHLVGEFCASARDCGIEETINRIRSIQS